MSTTDRLHEKLGISPTAVTNVAAVWAWLDLTAAELLSGEVATHCRPPGTSGGARYCRGEVERLLHVGAVRSQPEVLRVDGVFGSRSKILI